MTRQAVHALSRFGLGARPGDIATIQNDPKGWVLEMLNADPDDVEATRDRPTANSQTRIFRRIERLERQMENGDGNAESAIEALYEQLEDALEGDAEARVRQAILTTNPVQEKFVRFWQNHFTVSARKESIAPFVGRFEREAIRPHVTGSFYNMLLAAERHPAMLMYLDNHISVGPNSPVGREENIGFNENLAREILELHTLGAGAPYTTEDVRAFARILTGWTVGNGDFGTSLTSKFAFASAMHEPGPKTVLGRRYNQAGRLEGERALRSFSRRPETASFIAAKLVRHFVADTPRPADVAVVARAFRESDGDLMTVYRSLIGLDSGWNAPLTKARPAEDYGIAVFRALDIRDIESGLILDITASLGQESYMAPGPNGYPDVARFWLSGQGVGRRAQFAALMARESGGIEPNDLMQSLFGPLFSNATRDAIARAGRPSNALGVALASPEMLMM